MVESILQSGDFLRDMARASAERLKVARAGTSLAALERQAAAQKAPPSLQLSGDGFDLIAEVKKNSPSAGQLADSTLSPALQASEYALGGAAAISVLTEPTRFSGALSDLEQVVETVTTIPVMRKDFLVDPYQVIEARAAGAGGVLLIAAMLEPPVLRDMLQTTFDLGMFALVEAFDEPDLLRCIPSMVDLMPAINDDGTCRMLLGINSRNLRTLDVEFLRFKWLAEQLPEPIPWVAESGIDTLDKVTLVAGAGYCLALIGTALMRSDEPKLAAQAFIKAGRTARRS